MTERRAFLALMAVEVALFAWFAAERRIPRGHDTFQLYTLQHVMLSNAAGGGGPCYWLPGATQGTASNWHLAWQGGPVQCLLLLIAPALAGAGFIPLFWASMLIEELVFLGGIWRLARRRVRSPVALLFVGAAAAATCVWQDQVWHSFRALFALPLLLALVEEVLEEPRLWKAALAGNLFVIQSVGNLPYVPVTTGFVAAVWLFAGLTGARPGTVRPRIDGPRLRALATGVAALLATAAVAWLQLTDHADEAVLRAPGRAADGSVTVDSFMTFAGHFNPIRFLDFAIGLSPSIDYTLFLGPVTIALAILAAIGKPDRETRRLLLVVFVILLFSTGFLGLVAALAYYGVPMMTLYRHVGLAAPFAKLPILLLAGIGMERLALGRRPPPCVRVVHAAVWGLGGLGLLAFAAGALPSASLSGALLTAQHTGDEAPAIAGRAAALVLALAGLGALVAAAAPLAAGSPRRLAALVAVHAILLFSWKTVLIREKTHACSPAQAALQRLEPVPFAPRRSLNLLESARFRILQPDFFPSYFQNRVRGYGEMYWTTDAYLHLDTPASPFRTTDWSRSVDRLMRACGRQPLDSSVPLACWDNYRLTFPLEPPSTAAVIGMTHDKLQVFSAAHEATPQVIARLLGDPAYPGGLLLIDGEGDAPRSPAADERLAVKPDVLAFDANRLCVRVGMPAKGWLYYADAWHPSWTATVNGAPVAIERANLAHKAVVLPAGESIVEFRFAPPVRRVCWTLLSINAAAWIVIAGFLGFPRRQVSEISPRDLATDP